MFLKNSWYVAAWDYELGAQPLARSIVGEPVAMFRTADGRAVALEDRCVHRNLPLSLGRVVGEHIQCGYHGLEFDSAGACVAVPGQTQIPPGACVRSFPAVERYHWLWLWMGDPALADPALIPDFCWMDMPGWAAKGDLLHVRCNYQLIVDNLLDQVHLAFVHPNTLGDPSVYEIAQMKVVPTDRDVTSIRWMLGREASRLYREKLGLPGPIDRWQIVNFTPPCFVRLSLGGAPSIPDRSGYTDVHTPTPEGGVQFRNLNAATPETETTTHYFWSQAQNIWPDDDDFTEMRYRMVVEAFEEDRLVLEAQQKSLTRNAGAPTVDVNYDAAQLQARRLMDRLLAAEVGRAAAQ